MQLMARLFAQSVETSIQPVIKLMEHPPEQPLIPWDRNSPVDLSLKSLRLNDARRLYDLTRHLVEDR
ncbi:hypothetical protein D3C71_2114110 [compost metagenome]